MSDLTYEGAGWTRGLLDGGTPPAGWRRLHASLRLPGADLRRAGEALLTWQVHRAAGVRVLADRPRAEVGGAVTTLLGVGPLALPAPCRVVWVEEGADLVGFGYGTLPGHPFVGEEAFAVRRQQDGSVRFEVRASSRPARWWSRLAGPVAPPAQRAYVHGLARALRRL
ncbi:DUF1990 family protein [Aquipuribacter hungaricus]|uniref:DUF1990 family protein n=1 Tax=Aquipuribacter hungaricus TaxID=545624 RepID=A0ABV7WI75_9MICO